MNDLAIENADSEDLEVLFDSIVMAQSRRAEGAATDVAAGRVVSHQAEDSPAGKVICSIGRMTRALHDSLRELGYDKMLEKAASTIPDARDRLAYVAVMTEQAAERALNATEIAKPIQDELGDGAVRLSGQWRKLFDRELNLNEFKSLVMQTRDYLEDVPNQTRATNAQLLEIMMAQDFQDLTGQVIKKIIDLAQNLEQQLVQLLLENAAIEKGHETGAGLLNGPVISGKGRSDVVTSQSQVDELLESLGF